MHNGAHTVLELMRLSTTYLAGRGVDTPRLDAEVLLAHVLQIDRVGLYVNFDRPLEPSEVDRYREVIARRARREPVAYILGEKEFMGRPFRVSPDVLIPRPETELLVEAVVRELNGDDSSPAPQLLDVGTGSGCIAITLALSLPTAIVTAVDISPAALAIAKENAHLQNVTKRVEFLQSDVFRGLASGATYTCIVSNPPYIPVGEQPSLSAEVRREPVGALFAGSDGLQVMRRLIAEAPSRLTPGGLLALEIGAPQGEAICTLGAAAGFTSIEVLPDYAGRDRVALLRTKGE